MPTSWSDGVCDWLAPRGARTMAGSPLVAGWAVAPRSLAAADNGWALIGWCGAGVAAQGNWRIFEGRGEREAKFSGFSCQTAGIRVSDSS